MTLKKETLEAAMWALCKARDDVQSMLEEIIAAINEGKAEGAEEDFGSDTRPAPKKAPAVAASKKHTFSPAARKRIVAAQKKRWAAYHAAQKAAA